MKRRKKTISVFIIIIFSSSLLYLCIQDGSTNIFEYPGIVWGMSVEETLDSYGLTAEDTSLYNVSGRGAVFVIDGHEAFGEKTSKIIFNYIDFADNGRYELCDVKVLYPDSADMTLVLRELQKAYGKTVPEVVIYEQLSPFGSEALAKHSYAESDEVKLWAGSVVADFIPKAESESYEKGWEFFQTGLTPENWNEFTQNARTVSLIWSTEGEENMLKFDAYQFGVYKELNRRLSETQQVTGQPM